LSRNDGEHDLFDVLPLRFKYVPENGPTLPGVEIQKAKWGNGVFWKGSVTIPAGTFVTVFPGTVLTLKISNISTIDSQYMIALNNLTSDNKKMKKGYGYFLDPNPKYTGDLTPEGIGHICNSSSPLNKIGLERYPNVRYYESRKLDGTFVLLLQAIDDIRPDEQILADYHAQLNFKRLCYTCYCVGCTETLK
jgi:hypothetical protein